MDNLTHSLIGAVTGDMAARFAPAAKSSLPEATRRNLFMTLMVVGNNLPDADLLYTGILDGNLGYLLHHRGHTHTLIGAVVAAALMFALSTGWLRWRGFVASTFDRYWLAGIALLAPLMHLAMDFTNSYGVHPFWPFNNHWLYGDSVFIVEPLFWAAAAPLVFLLRQRLRRVVMSLILLIAVGLSFGIGLVPTPMATGLLLLIVALLLVGKLASNRVAALASFLAMAAVLLMFVVAGRLARHQMNGLMAAQFPTASLLDSVLTPMPVNPLCWDAIVVQLEGDRYTLRRALMSIAPGLLPAEQCPALNINGPTTLAFTPVAVADSPALAWHGEAVMSRRDVQTVIQSNCEASALSRFARALWVQRDNAAWIVGDLRFDREPGPGFAEIVVAADPVCPANVPPWTPPRNDVLMGL
jgi:inner membrane protein